MNRREIVNGLWIGRPLSLIEQLSIESFLQHGHEYHLYCYEKIEGVPAGATVMDANEIIPASEIFYYQHGPARGGVAAFADQFRYKLLLDRGGWWADTDIVCLRPFDFSEPAILVAKPDGKPGGVINALMKLPPGHEISRQCYDYARQFDRKRILWSEIGPPLLTEVVKRCRRESLIKPAEWFSPVFWEDWKIFLTRNPPRVPYTDQSYSLHLFHERWRRDSVQINADPRSFDGTIFGDLLRRYGLLSPAAAIPSLRTGPQVSTRFDAGPGVGDSAGLDAIPFGR